MINVITLDETKLDEMIRRAAKAGAMEALENFARQTPEADEVGDIHFAAKITKLEVSTIYSYCSKREIPFSKPRGKLMFLRSELLTWIKNGKRKTVAEITSK